MCNTNDCEWGFDTPPEQVDMQRMWDEVLQGTLVQRSCYMSALHKNAPLTHGLFLKWIREHRPNGAQGILLPFKGG